MPIFEYKCASCGAVSEFLVGVAQESDKIQCSECGSGKLEKVFSPMSFSVKVAQPGCRTCPAQELGASRSACEASGCPRAV